MKTIAVVGTLDTKGREFEYLKEEIISRGCAAKVIDCGMVGEPYFEADVTRHEVAAAAGSSIHELVTEKELGEAMEVMARGSAAILKRYYEENAVQGAISMGGGQGTFLGMRAMSALPIGVPKVMLSTLALVVKELFTGGRDTVIMDPGVDVCGLNRVLCSAMSKAAAAVCAMTCTEIPAQDEKRPVIAVSMYGVTTKCVDMLRQLLENAGYEVWAFHATGAGGRNMEELINLGLVDGVVDLTLAEVSQTLLGGTAATIETRLEAAGNMGIPQIICPGGVDVVNFLGPESIPERYRNSDRVFHMHNPTTTLMRSSEQEAVSIGKIIAGKLSRAKGPVRVLLPVQGISAYDKAGGVWHDPAADAALFESIEANADSGISIERLNLHINDREFAGALSEAVIDVMKSRGR